MVRLVWYGSVLGLLGRAAGFTALLGSADRADSSYCGSAGCLTCVRLGAELSGHGQQAVVRSSTVRYTKAQVVCLFSMPTYSGL